ncbi:FxLYD domain-containing protein [Patescibacteria group bacterium]
MQKRYENLEKLREIWYKKHEQGENMNDEEQPKQSLGPQGGQTEQPANQAAVPPQPQPGGTEATPNAADSLPDPKDAEPQPEMNEYGTEVHSNVSGKYKRLAFFERHAFGFERGVLIVIGLIFSIIVFLIGYGIIRAVLPEADADNDGVGNSIDECPGEDDREDDDKDGIPDGCDNSVPPITFEDVDFSKADVVEMQERIYDVVFRIENRDPDWGLFKIDYIVNLNDSSGEILKSQLGTSYVLPGTTATVIESNMSTSKEAVSAEILFDGGEFRSSLADEPVQLEIREPRFTPQNAEGRAEFIASVENDSNYDLDSVDVKVLILDQQGKVVSTNFTQVNTLTTDEKREFTMRWSEGFASDVSFEIEATTNVMDRKNLLRKKGEPIEF